MKLVYESAPALLGLAAAVFSPCRRYRYLLRRRWLGGKGSCLFVMLNPSTATASADDPTVRRCVGFARGWGCHELVVANLFALRATDPAALKAAADPVGPGNDHVLKRAAGAASLIVAAWGAHPFAADRARAVKRLLGREVTCLGTTRGGAPRHPLYLPRGAELEDYEP